MNRRDFLANSTSCAAHLWLVSGAMSPLARSLFAARPTGRVLAQEPWGRIERIAPNVWALISTPLAGGPDARRTLSNGGIVSGSNGTLVIEGFASDAGAAWLAERARELTGRFPTHVILTHYHGDHSNGLAAYRRPEGAPAFVTTEATLGLLRTGVAQRASLAPVVELLERGQLVTPDKPLTLDLGGIQVQVTPRSGHTPSDLSITVQEPRVVFCGDLLWNGMFPNYRDAIPSVLSREVRAMTRESGATYVPGHGSIPSAGELRNYVGLLDHIEQAARRAFAAGTPAADAARQFSMPPALGNWHRFSDSYYQVALSAWERELKR